MGAGGTENRCCRPCRLPATTRTLVESGLEGLLALACVDLEETRRKDQDSEGLHLSLSGITNLLFST